MRIEKCGKLEICRTGHSFSNDLALLLVSYRRIVNILGAQISPFANEADVYFPEMHRKKSLNCTLITRPCDESVKCVPLLHGNIPGVRDTGSRITVHSDCNDDDAVLNANPRYRVSTTLIDVMAPIYVNIILAYLYIIIIGRY